MPLSNNHQAILRATLATFKIALEAILKATFKQLSAILKAIFETTIEPILKAAFKHSSSHPECHFQNNL